MPLNHSKKTTLIFVGLLTLLATGVLCYLYIAYNVGMSSDFEATTQSATSTEGAQSAYSPEETKVRLSQPSVDQRSPEEQQKSLDRLQIGLY